VQNTKEVYDVSRAKTAHNIQQAYATTYQLAYALTYMYYVLYTSSILDWTTINPDHFNKWINEQMEA